MGIGKFASVLRIGFHAISNKAIFEDAGVCEGDLALESMEGLIVLCLLRLH